MQRQIRIKKELAMETKNPTPGISCWLTTDDSIDSIDGLITGPEDTPFEGGCFKVKVTVPERYPFEPPQILFVTKVYHPNIDNMGRICLDLLKMPPQGSWKPNLNIALALKSIRLLLSQPNPDDPLMADIASEFSMNPKLFKKKAREWTNLYAKRS